MPTRKKLAFNNRKVNRVCFEIIDTFEAAYEDFWDLSAGETKWYAKVSAPRVVLVVWLNWGRTIRFILSYTRYQTPRTHAQNVHRQHLINSRPEPKENYISDYSTLVRNCDFFHFFREPSKHTQIQRICNVFRADEDKKEVRDYEKRKVIFKIYILWWQWTMNFYSFHNNNYS